MSAIRPGRASNSTRVRKIRTVPDELEADMAIDQRFDMMVHSKGLGQLQCRMESNSKTAHFDVGAAFDRI